MLRSARPPLRWSLSRLWIAQWKRHCGAGGSFAAEQQLPGVLDGVHLAEYRLDDRLAPGVDVRPFLVLSLRAIRCLGVAFFGIGPRGAGAGGS